MKAVATTADRLREIMDTRGLRQVDILRLCAPFCEMYDEAIRKNDLSQYVNGKVSPGQRKLTILSLALGVSEVWLMGYDVPMARDIEIAPSPDGDGRESELLSLFQLLTDEQKDFVIRSIKGLLSI